MLCLGRLMGSAAAAMTKAGAAFNVQGQCFQCHFMMELVDTVAGSRWWMLLRVS